MQTLSPVQVNEREIFMDVLRGFAILGIFIANLNGLSWYSNDAKITGPFLLPDWDHKMSFLHQMFIEGKFYSIFSLLFGWGIALQIKRGKANGINPIPTVKRRLQFMLLLGFMHLPIGNFVFLGAGLGYMGQVGPVYFTLFGIAVFIVQIILSTSSQHILTMALWSGCGEVLPIKNGNR